MNNLFALYSQKIYSYCGTLNIRLQVMKIDRIWMNSYWIVLLKMGWLWVRKNKQLLPFYSSYSPPVHLSAIRFELLFNSNDAKWIALKIKNVGLNIGRSPKEIIVENKITHRRTDSFTGVVGHSQWFRYRLVLIIWLIICTELVVIPNEIETYIEFAHFIITYTMQENYVRILCQSFGTFYPDSKFTTFTKVLIRATV